MAKGPNCPNCATALPDDYGMVTCPNCSNVVFVDMEGVAQTTSGNPPLGEFDLRALQNLAAPKSDAPSTETPGSSELNMEAFLGYEQPSPDSPADSLRQTQEPSQIDPNDPLGISAYANSEISSAKDGPLVVTVIISGIDSKELRQEIREALQDSRFGWEAGALMATIRSGVLRLEQINPVKAMIVINRIKSLAIQIRWEQSAITDLDISEKDFPS